MEGKKYEGQSINLNDRENWVAIIGSRKANEMELQSAYKFAQRCVKKGKIVVSGLALGVDTAAHQGAIDANGKTIAIVSTPSFQSIYPKENKELAMQIKQFGGILYPFTSRPQENEGKGLNQFQKRLIERDALLAFLCPVIVVVKEDEEIVKGGTKWAMNYGLTHGKRLFRLNNDGKLIENPDFQKTTLFWEPELKIDGVFK
jgi:DNA processing protein